MDSPVALALMAKAQAIFDNDNVFLSFPITPLAFTKSQLSFLAEGAGTADSLNGLANFTRIVNQIPGNPVWLPTGAPYLWDVYGDVLKSAQLAQSTRTAEEQAEYQKAFAYLHIVHDDGTWEDTVQVKTYNQYRNTSFAQQQDYNNRKIAADLSTDPAVKQQWQNVDEPALQAQMQALLNDWIINGYKAQVEDAESTYIRLGAKSPNQIWAQWQSQFNPSIDTVTDTNGQSVFITGYSPSDIINAPDWQHFTLTGDEVATLMSSAPDALKKCLASDAVNLDIDLFSFEYASVSLTRPWLQTDIFDAQFWRFNDGSTSLSDGQYPSTGRYPAYVVSVVFARNIEVRLKAQSTMSNAAVQRLQSNQGLSLGSFALSASSQSTETDKQSILHSHPPMLTPVNPADIPHPIETFNPADISRTIEPVSSELTPNLVAATRANTMLQRVDYESIPPRRWGPSTHGNPPPQPPVTSDDSIYIMAFICKILPLCPDPDLTLKW